MTNEQITVSRELLRRVLELIQAMEQNYGSLWQVSATAEHLDKLDGQLRDALEQPAVEPVNFDQIAADRYKVVEAHESLFHRWAVVAGNGTQQLYLGRELECQNMARKFAGAFLDGAWLASQHTAPQAQQPAEVTFLTDKEILEMTDDGVFLGNVKEIARAVEAAVRKKAGLK